MKKCSVVISFFLVFAIIASFSGCNKTEVSQSKYVGTWVGKSVSILDEESIDDDDKMISDTLLEFKADGTVTGKISGETVNCTWSETKEGVQLKGDIKVKAKFEGDELVMNLIGLKLHLVKE